MQMSECKSSKYFLNKYNTVGTMNKQTSNGIICYGGLWSQLSRRPKIELSKKVLFLFTLEGSIQVFIRMTKHTNNDNRKKGTSRMIQCSENYVKPS